jgi:uncharacterized DUF497 family protein
MWLGTKCGPKNRNRSSGTIRSTLEANSSEGEERFLSLGSTDKGRILLVVTTWREHRIRVISAFAPAKRLVRFYLTERGK